MHKQSKEQIWNERLLAQGASGLSIKRWCLQEGVTTSSFHYWRKQLAAAPATGFIALPAVARTVEAALELRTPEGYVIRLSSQAQVGWLNGVLAALR
ncbi:MAG: hypothetical protein QG667_1633 [Pseudomonadota bacterium]|nr:hypothetical protein [Pseudomonadota bacterium]